MSRRLAATTVLATAAAAATGIIGEGGLEDLAGLVQKYRWWYPNISRTSLQDQMEEAVDRVLDPLGLLNPLHFVCAPAFDEPCPRGGYMLDNTTCTLSSWAVSDQCGASIPATDLSAAEKTRLAFQCKVKWPCRRPARQEWLHRCPSGWKTFGPQKCEAPRAYKGACGPVIDLSSATIGAKVLIADVCDVTWPAAEPCRCDDDDLTPCPLHWTVEGALCLAPLHDLSPCSPQIAMSALKDPKTRCILASQCKLEFNCDRRQNTYRDLSDSFLRQVKDIIESPMPPINDNLTESWTLANSSSSSRFDLLESQSILTSWLEIAQIHNASVCPGDFAKDCPQGWLGHRNLCVAPSSYEGRCPRLLPRPPSVMVKKVYAAACEAPWPCLIQFAPLTAALSSPLPETLSQTEPLAPPYLYGPVSDLNGSIIPDPAIILPPTDLQLPTPPSSPRAPDSFLELEKFNLFRSLPNRQQAAESQPPPEELGLFSSTQQTKQNLKRRLPFIGSGLPKEIDQRTEEEAEWLQRMFAEEGDMNRVRPLSCKRDYTGACPLYFTLAGTICMSDTFSALPAKCDTPLMDTSSWTEADKRQAEINCAYRWPCMSCTRDYVRPYCPEEWSVSADRSCTAPSWMEMPSGCRRKIDFSSMSISQKHTFADMCGQDWPCYQARCEPNYSPPCPIGWVLLPIEAPSAVTGGHLCASTKWKGLCPDLTKTHPDMTDALIEAAQRSLNTTINRTKLKVLNVPNDIDGRMQLEDLCGLQWPCNGQCIENFKPKCPYEWTYSQNECTAPHNHLGNLCGVKNFDVKGWGAKTRRAYGRRCGLSWPCVDQCEMDWSQVCPWKWAFKTGGGASEMQLAKLCWPPRWYRGPCPGPAHTAMMSFAERQAFAVECGAPWPCAGYIAGIVPNPFTSGTWQSPKIREDPVATSRKVYNHAPYPKVTLTTMRKEPLLRTANTDVESYIDMLPAMGSVALPVIPP